MTYTAHINRKGLDATGVTEDVAKDMYGSMGAATLAVVELEHVGRADNSKGDHEVTLTIGMCEPVVDSPEVENALRELTRALYRARKARQGDALPGVDGDQPSTADALRDLDAVIDPWEDPDAGRTDDPESPKWDGSMDDEVARRRQAAAALGADD